MEHMYNNNKMQEQGWVTVGMPQNQKPWGHQQNTTPTGWTGGEYKPTWTSSYETQGWTGENQQGWTGENQQGWTGECQQGWTGESQQGWTSENCCQKQSCIDDQCQQTKCHGGNQNGWGKKPCYNQHKNLMTGLEKMNLGNNYNCRQTGKCCDEEMIKLIKELVIMQFGAEQTYNQISHLCFSEKFNWINCGEYFRLCGMRMRFLGQGLLKHSERMMNFNELINETTMINNLIRVPSKEELATNDFNGVLKRLFQTGLECEKLVEKKMYEFVEKMRKVDWVTSGCQFDGFKWFTAFVLPYQVRFTHTTVGRINNLELCENAWMFDKVEIKPLVNKIEEFIFQLPIIFQHKPTEVSKRLFEEYFLGKF